MAGFFPIYAIFWYCVTTPINSLSTPLSRFRSWYGPKGVTFNSQWPFIDHRCVLHRFTFGTPETTSALLKYGTVHIIQEHTVYKSGCLIQSLREQACVACSGLSQKCRFSRRNLPPSVRKRRHIHRMVNATKSDKDSMDSALPA
jgi:hypothetical protein